VADAFAVVHNAAHHRFEAHLGTEIARADYRLEGPVMQLVHTEVPPRFRGRGIAGKVVAAALAYARERKLTVMPLCSYARAYMRRHPDAAALLAPGARL
jgi:predicted GNAT family acetyltransferase